MSVSWVRLELQNLSLVYDLVADCCDGDFKIKSRTERYLPKPNPLDKSDENKKRYESYLHRAVFYNVTKNTLKGLLGQIFAKDSQIELPSELEIFNKNVDGRGNSINQLAKQGISSLLKTGRFGLLSDYPNINELVKPPTDQGAFIESNADDDVVTMNNGITKDEIFELDVRPFIRLYDSPDIINWRTAYVGAEIVLTLVVLREKVTYNFDEFVSKEQIRYRVLKLNDDGNYQVDLYESTLQNADIASLMQNQNSLTVNVPVLNKTLTSIPTDIDGNFIKRIPFEFCGTESNLPDVNVPILYDIAALNIAHYHNSADYEESCFITGQPTVYFSGLTQEWVKEVLENKIQLGSRGGVALPAGASAGILQSQPNTMPYEAMQHKEEQFLALGAKLVSPNSSTQTATEAEMNNTAETSILATLANNASECFENAIEHCSLFVKTSAVPIFKLNTDFEISKLTTLERAELISEWMKNAISFTEMRNNLRAGKVQLLDDAKAQKEIDQETVDGFNMDKLNPTLNQPIAPGPGVKPNKSVGNQK